MKCYVQSVTLIISLDHGELNSCEHLVNRVKQSKLNLDAAVD